MAPPTAVVHQGRRVRWLLIDFSLSYGHHGLSPCSTHQEEGTVSILSAVGPVMTPQTTKIAPVAVLKRAPMRALRAVGAQK